MVNTQTIGEQSDLFKNLRERSKHEPTGFLFLAIFWTRSSKNFPTFNSHLETLDKTERTPLSVPEQRHSPQEPERRVRHRSGSGGRVQRGRGLSCKPPEGLGTRSWGCWNCSLHTSKDPQRAPPLGWGVGEEKSGR